MMIFFGLVVFGGAAVLGLHVMARGAPEIDDVLSGLPVVHRFPSAFGQSVVQVRREDVNSAGGPLADALAGAADIRIAGRRFVRFSPGQYRCDDWTADATLIVRAGATGQLVEIDYRLRRKW